MKPSKSRRTRQTETRKKTSQRVNLAGKARINLRRQFRDEIINSKSRKERTIEFDTKNIDNLDKDNLASLINQLSETYLDKSISSTQRKELRHNAYQLCENWLNTHDRVRLKTKIDLINEFKEIPLFKGHRNSKLSPAGFFGRLRSGRKNQWANRTWVKLNKLANRFSEERKDRRAAARKRGRGAQQTTRGVHRGK